MFESVVCETAAISPRPQYVDFSLGDIYDKCMRHSNDVSVGKLKPQSRVGWDHTCNISTGWSTVYPKKYAHGFVVLCFVVVVQSFIMNSHELFIHIHQGCFAGTGAIVRLPQCQWSKPDGYGKISQCITTTKHSKAKTVCIFLGIYCTYVRKWFIKVSNIYSLLKEVPSFFRLTLLERVFFALCQKSNFNMLFVSIRVHLFFLPRYHFNIEPLSQITLMIESDEYANYWYIAFDWITEWKPNV